MTTTFRFNDRAPLPRFPEIKMFTVVDNHGEKYRINNWNQLREIVGNMHGISAPVGSVKKTGKNTAEFLGRKFRRIGG